MEIITLHNDFDALMTGEETYPIIGDQVSEEIANQIIQKFSGLPLYAGCLEKAQIVSRALGGATVIGALTLYNKRRDAAYKYLFNPPYEFHAWTEKPGSVIIDFGLPGTVLRGLALKDEQGAFLEGRDPVILAGRPEIWMVYKPKQYILGEI